MQWICWSWQIHWELSLTFIGFECNWLGFQQCYVRSKQCVFPFTGSASVFYFQGFPSSDEWRHRSACNVWYLWSWLSPSDCHNFWGFPTLRGFKIYITINLQTLYRKVHWNWYFSLAVCFGKRFQFCPRWLASTVPSIRSSGSLPCIYYRAEPTTPSKPARS